MVTKKEWFKDDGLWQAVKPILFDKQRIGNASKEVDDMIALTGIKYKSRVLDLCCGVGRHSIQFAARGFDVTGVDATRNYIETAKKEAVKHDVKIKFIKDDMRGFCNPASYDLIISFFSSFGYFENQEDDFKVLQNAFLSLRNGGEFLIDILGKEIIKRNYQRKNWREEEGYVLLEERVIEKNLTGINTRWVIIRDGKRIELNIFHRLYSEAELSRLLRRAGFSEVKIYGDITGKPYNINANRLIAVATK